MTALPATALRLGLHLLLAFAILSQGLAFGAVGALHDLGHAGVGAPVEGSAPLTEMAAETLPCHSASPEPGTDAAPDHDGCAGLCLWVCSMAFAALPAPATKAVAEAPGAQLVAEDASFTSRASLPPQRPPIAS